MPLSDAQMDAMFNDSSQKGPLSDAQMDSMFPKSNSPEQSLGQKTLSAIGTAGKALDSVTGAPTRAAIYAVQNGQNPLKAGWNQFANMTDQAPGGSDIAAKAGLSTEDSPGYLADLPGNIPQDQVPRIRSNADIAGQGIDLTANPLNFAGPILRGVSKVADFWRPASEVADTLSNASQVQKASGEASAAGKSSANISGGDLSIEQSGKLFSTKAPESLDELRNWTPNNNDSSVAGKARMQQIVQDVPDLQTKPLQYHYDMLDNPKAMKALKLNFENLPTKDAQKIAAYNQQMVNEAGQKVVNTVGDISEKPPMSLSDAGDDLISTVKDKYNAEKTALGPAFDELNSSASRMPRAETMDLAQAIGANTKIGKLMNVDPETGKLFLADNSPKTGISDAEHSVLSRVVGDMNNGMTFKDIQNTRDFLRKAIDPANPGATEELGKARSILLDQLGNMADAKGPNVADTFKAYAINERARESVEKVIGGKIESLDSMYSANPERVVNKIFSNPNYAKTVGAYVGPDKMNDLIASYINKGVQSSTDSVNGFNPTKMRQWLKTNDSFMKTYADPETTKRLSALSDYGYLGKRFLDEVNPSGTAASLEAMLKPEGFVNKVKHGGIVGALETEVTSRVNNVLRQRQAIKNLNNAMSTQKPSIPVNSFLNNFTNTPNYSGPAASIGTNYLNQQNNNQQNNGPKGYSDGGTVTPSVPLPNIDPQKAQSAQESMRKAFGFAAGGVVPGTPQFPMNTPQNDNTLIKATPGEVVLPLSVTQSSNPPQMAKEFMANQTMNNVQQGPQKGPEKWAADGMQNMKMHVGDSDKEWLVANKGKLMLDPKTQNLLITASSFEPGSKPLDDIMKHLKNRLDKK